MPDNRDPATSSLSFRLGDWWVEPSLNRLSRGSESVQLEPRAMDLLEFLARFPGEVLSQETLVDGVWSEQYVGEAVLRNTIAALRGALGDDARKPTYIQTISKRGYRLIAPISFNEPPESSRDRQRASSATLEEVVSRRPYPGLEPFTEDDSTVFFGREQEVTAVWRRLRESRLLGIIGASGVGKSSLLRAGVVPAAPAGWGVVVCTPGAAPFTSLAKALVSATARDTETIQQLLDFNLPEVAVDIVSRWRRSYDEAVLIVDQLEELFTHSTVEEQARFASLLGEMIRTAGVRVVLSMRDDFLMRCRDHEALAPVFDCLVPLAAPVGPALRRAVVDPAHGRGYRFEDDALVDEILAEVEGERGALPLLAFAVSRLWDERDRQYKILTREACLRIGGIGGALARHAEETLSSIGPSRQPIVRELLRNLVTREGTRAIRETDDLLSVFDEDVRDEASGVLDALVDSRLLTAFDDPETTGREVRRRRVEIVHESLLEQWPRLAGWRTQDADAARLRDELRQAARTWDEHDRSDDLLWTGSASRELALWRERYPGGLTDVEQAFVGAVSAHAAHRRMRRRMLLTASFLIAAAVAAAFAVLWRHSVGEGRRAAAQHLLSLAREDRETWGQQARTLAYSMASLKMADTRSGRELALHAGLQGPLPFMTHHSITVNAAFSPDGRWLAASDYTTGEALVWSSRGGGPHRWKVVDPAGGAYFGILVTPDSSAVMTYSRKDPLVRFWSVPDGRPLGTAEKGPFAELEPVASDNVLRYVIRPLPGDGDWTLDLRGAEALLRIGPTEVSCADLSPGGDLLAYAVGPSVLVEGLQEPRDREPQPVGRHDKAVVSVRFDPEGRRVAAVDGAGELRLWSLDGDAETPLRRWPGFPPSVTTLAFSPDGRLLAVVWGQRVKLVDLAGPPDAEPLTLRKMAPTFGADFDPSGRWLAAAGALGVHLWPLDRDRTTTVLAGESSMPSTCAFDPGGRWLVSASAEGRVRWWPLEPGPGRSRVLFETAGEPVDIGIDPRRVAVAWGADRVRLIPVDGGPPLDLQGPGEALDLVTIGGDGRFLAACGKQSTVLRVWDLGTGTLRSLDAGDGLGAVDLRALPDGRVLVRYSADEGEYPGLGLWQLETGRRELVFAGEPVRWFFGLPVADHGRLVLGAERIEPDRVVRRFFVGDLQSRTVRALDGSIGISASLDPLRRTIVVWGPTRLGPFLRVGTVDAPVPHLIPARQDAELFGDMAFSPDGRRIARGYGDGSIWLLPVPDLGEPPPQTLSRDALVARLGALTNLRAVPDEASDTGWTIEIGPFPGWASEPDAE